MKEYKTFEEINYDLKVCHLERQIAFEQLKEVKNDLKSSLTPPGWVSFATKLAGKYGLMLLIKRILK